MVAWEGVGWIQKKTSNQSTTGGFGAKAVPIVFSVQDRYVFIRYYDPY
jgi:hypothetical protein